MNPLLSGATDAPDAAVRRSVWRGLVRQKYILILVTAAVVAVTTTNFSSYAVYVVDTILLAAIGALALDLLMGTGGQVSIGNAAFLAAGAYTTVWTFRAGVPFPFDVIAGGVLCAAGGLIVGLPALRIRGMYLALATLAAFYLASFAALKYQVHAVGAAGFFLTPVFPGTIGEQAVSWAWLLVGVLAATIVAVSWLGTGRSGRAWRMIRDHEVAAAVMGIEVARYKLTLFVISSAIIGVQGGLTARFTASVTYENFSLALSISVIAMILIGGLDSLAGPLIGAVVVILLPILVPSVIDTFVTSSTAAHDASGYAEIAYGVLIMIFMIAAPKGLVGLVRGLGVKACAVRRRGAARGRTRGTNSTR
ncbi:branched-chain amino acid ABC transporter permease [Streptomyces sp. NPDC055140]